VRLADLAVSRDHAAIERSEHGFVIVDRGSTNGCWSRTPPSTGRRC